MQREAMQTAPTLDTILQDTQFYNNVFVRRRLLSLSHKNCERSQRKESLTCGNSENSVLSQWSDDFPGTEWAASSPSGLLRALPCSQTLAASPFHRNDKKNLSIFEGGNQICSFTQSVGCDDRTPVWNTVWLQDRSQLEPQYHLNSSFLSCSSNIYHRGDKLLRRQAQAVCRALWRHLGASNRRAAGSEKKNQSAQMQSRAPVF